MERVMNFENLGTRIMENRTLDQKIWTLEAFRGGIALSEGSGAILEFLEWLDGLGTKYRGSCKIWKKIADFCGILDGLEGLKT
jgi:hypothetical protein